MYLNVSDNKLTSLDLSHNNLLTTLSCAGNKISSLDLTVTPLLMELICSHNNLVTLNLANNLDLSTDWIAKWNTQSAQANYFSPDGGTTNYIDMAEVVGKENTGKIKTVTGGTYDAKTALIRLDSPLPSTITYYYDTQSVFSGFQLAPGDRVVNEPISDMDVTLTLASSTAPTYQVVFFTSEGTEISRINVPKGALLTKPDDPQKTGFRFLGWHIKDTQNKLIAWDFNTPVTSDLQLFEVWQAITPDNPDTPDKPEPPNNPVDKPGAPKDNQATPDIPAAGNSDILIIAMSLFLCCAGAACLLMGMSRLKKRITTM
jgi:hypothetical protein